ncbi:MAG: hypothetical protein HC772_13970 [Leptolyngbyaceae cyanobacterium CRU_2_3]|nr:hypothetical protein [Leptolyngbyaceae cyanobacterium CRU_2_3]
MAFIHPPVYRLAMKKMLEPMIIDNDWSSQKHVVDLNNSDRRLKSSTKSFSSSLKRSNDLLEQPILQLAGKLELDSLILISRV